LSKIIFKLNTKILLEMILKELSIRKGLLVLSSLMFVNTTYNNKNMNNGSKAAHRNPRLVPL
jgi:hypothetical protein